MQSEEVQSSNPLMDAGICDINFKQNTTQITTFIILNTVLFDIQLESYHWNYGGTNMELTEISEGSWNVVGAITDGHGNFFCHIK